MANKLAEGLEFIKHYPRQYSPTVREIADGTGISSTSIVQRYLLSHYTITNETSKL